MAPLSPEDHSIRHSFTPMNVGPEPTLSTPVGGGPHCIARREHRWRVTTPRQAVVEVAPIAMWAPRVAPDPAD